MKDRYDRMRSDRPMVRSRINEEVLRYRHIRNEHLRIRARI